MRRLLAFAVLCAALAAMVAQSALAADGPKNNDNAQHVQLLAFNDLHGNLEPPTGSGGRITVGVGKTVDAGGVEYMSTWINRLRATNPNTFVVGAGDQIGASPLLSALFHDEPTIEALNAMGLDVSGVGNHEFDEGVTELLRMQYGNQLGGDGCHPIDGCQDGTPFGGSLFQYLAANVLYDSTHTTILPPYEIKKVGNAKIAFIGLTLQGTPNIVTPAGVAGLEFAPEVQTVNKLVSQLREDEGVRTFVVLIHQGGFQNPPYTNGYQNVDGCDNFTGDIKPIVEGLDPQVDLVVSAHTPAAYICKFNGILTTSAASFGRLITDIDLTIDHQTKDVTAITAHNQIVTRDVPKDPAITAILDRYRPLATPIANRIVGHITADIKQSANAAGESALGDVIADAQLAATSPTDFGGSVVAFMNPGGIRADLIYNNNAAGEAPGDVTYNEIFTVQPFANTLVVKTLTGDQIRRLLEQQFPNNRFLQVSKGFTYSYDLTRPAGDKVVPGSIAINGVPVVATQSYRVTMNSFLATGGDGFTVFNEGTGQLGGAVDVDALGDYLLKNSPVAPGPQDRIVKVG